MDKIQEEYQDRPAEEESSQYIWLAGAFVGGFLILMIIIIIGIVLWKYVKKQNTPIDQNWAGPSPLADGNLPEERSHMNSSILGRSMSLSQVSTTPIIAQEDHVMGGEIQFNGVFEKKEANEIQLPVSTNLFDMQPAHTRNEGLAPETKISPQITKKHLHDESFPPPPLDTIPDFPPPPSLDTLPYQVFTDNHLQPPSEMNSYLPEGNSTQEPFHLHISDTSGTRNSCNLDLLPPPPTDV